MPTIVSYTDAEPPLNAFPHCIISPTHSAPCCFSGMDDLGMVGREERYEYAYRRCGTCGFTVRQIVRPLPDKEDQERIAKLQEVLATAFNLRQ
jgi:hypothetical protein